MKWFAGLLFLVLLGTQFRLWWSDSGVRDVSRLRQSVAEARLQNQQLSERNRQMAEQVRDLKQGTAAIEELARSELGLIVPRETYYQVVEPAPAASAALSAPQAAPAADR
jgi:cell division protein FtsB